MKQRMLFKEMPLKPLPSMDSFGGRLFDDITLEKVKGPLLQCR